MIQQDESADRLQMDAKKTSEDKTFDALASKPDIDDEVKKVLVN